MRKGYWIIEIENKIFLRHRLPTDKAGSGNNITHIQSLKDMSTIFSIFFLEWLIFIYFYDIFL